MNINILDLLGWLAALTVVGCLLARVWIGILNHVLIHHEAIDSIESRQPYLPKVRMVASTLLATALLCVLSLNTLKEIEPFTELTPARSVVLFGVLGLVAIALQYKWKSLRDDVFAFMMGSAIAFVLLGANRVLLESDIHEDPYIMALAIVCIAVLWKLLFGPWTSRIKASVLGSFIVWIGIHIVFKDSSQERTAHLLAIMVALVPALLWCWLFLEYHVQRLGMVVLMFFAGMLSTAPILYYDLLVRRGVEMQFFLFRVVPENFNRVSSAFVSGSIVPEHGVQSTIVTTLISFIIVGFIEEFSKFWVLRKSGRPFFSSIDDVIQLAVIVAIGFAFAENVLNPTYFMGFIREFLITPEHAQWGAFMGNVTGRAILTNMVHIVSSGVMGYFLGRAIFARPIIEDTHESGDVLLVADTINLLLRLPTKMVYRVQMIATGVVSATMLHGLFNFMVTLPEVLPGRPQTVADLFGFAETSMFNYVSLLMIPSLFYVLGGFWMFTILFYRQSNMKVRGHIVTTDTFVRERSAL